MRAMILEQLGPVDRPGGPLRAAQMPAPDPGPGQVRIQVRMCGVCHTELDIIEGRTAPPRLPVVPGHQVVGTVTACGHGVDPSLMGRRVGVAWIHRACGRCAACRSGRENLCDAFAATGRDADGGYAEFMTAPAAFVHRLPAALGDEHAAPLLCAGAVGYRGVRLAGIADGRPVGLAGFGASNHLVLQMIRHLYPTCPVFVFARNPDERRFALELGAAWAGDFTDAPPQPVAAAIDTTPAWRPVLWCLEHLEPGGKLVINAIGKEAGDRQWLEKLDWSRHLWREKQVQSVANVTRKDVARTLELAVAAGLRPEVEFYDLAQANEALLDLRRRRIRGAKVLVVDKG